LNRVLLGKILVKDDSIHQLIWAVLQSARRDEESKWKNAFKVSGYKLTYRPAWGILPTSWKPRPRQIRIEAGLFAKTRLNTDAL
jgi:hypothetical protein